jgi:hypothetical protein
MFSDASTFSSSYHHSTCHLGGCRLATLVSMATKILGIVGFALAATSTSLLRAEKYYPDHPVVQEMVNRGVDYLNKSKLGGGAESSAEGVGLLAAYTVFKVTSDPQNRVVVQGIEIAKHLAAQTADTKYYGDEKIVYVMALAGILLPTVDVDAYGAPTKLIRDFFYRIQKPNGAWGYRYGKNASQGDISQTQYAMLCLWTMSQLGIEVSDERVAATIRFLVAAQAADGGWPYQYSAEGAEGTPTNSLSAAGLSALLISGDMLGLYRSKLAANQEEEGIIPIAFKRIVPESQRPKVNIDRVAMENATKRCEAYFVANPYDRNGKMWHYYYVYSKERYESFLEITKGKPSKSPDWYNRGVDSLKAVQAPSGSWGSISGDTDTIPPDVCTCFAILFLIRSTQKAIGELSEAMNKGIGPIPDDVSVVAISGGKIINKNNVTTIDDALKMLEDDSKAEAEDSLAPERMLLATDPQRRKEQLNRFSRLLNARDYKSRRIAAKMLGRGDDLDMVPHLIYALTDPDPEVPPIAENSLRLISRQLDTTYLPSKQKSSDGDKAKAALMWKKWYLNIRPDYVFID